MIGLSQYIYESDGLSDNEIWWRCGVNYLNWMQTEQAQKIVKKYKIHKTNPRPGVINYMTSTRPKLPSDSEEFIKRKNWDLDSVVGETEGQLMHKDYMKMADHILQTRKPNSKILTLFQCSSSKPYSENQVYKSNYFNPYGKFTDFACISNPGIIPIDHSQYYPYRYDEWNIPNEEKLNELINMTQKYRIVNMCRFIRFVKKSGYENVIVAIGNPYKQWIFDEMLKNNIAGCKDWLHIITTDSLRDTIVKNHPGLKAVGGILYTRTMLMPETRKKFANTLKKLVDQSELKDLENTIKERREKLSKKTNESLCESLDKPQYKMLQTIDYNEFITKFKKSIKDNMEDPSVDKGDNNLYYKSYYWTALDLLLLAMDGNLLEDIDKEYWEFIEKLKNDKDFINMSGFLFCYSPLMKNDSVSQNTIENEAQTLKLTWQKPKFELKSNLFN